MSAELADEQEKKTKWHYRDEKDSPRREGQLKFHKEECNVVSKKASWFDVSRIGR